MPELSACYFCGTALDAPLAEYPVVPDTLHPAPDQQRTVVLCPTCRRKVGAVVDAVIGAVDDAPEDATVQRELSESTGNGSSASPGTSSIDARRLDDDAAGDGSPAREDAADAPLGESGGADPDDGADTAAADDTPEDGGGFEFAGDADEGPADVAGATGDGAGASEADETPADADGPAAADPDGGATEDGAPEQSGEDPEMTALEYNKVMRLLQNRDFPVDREEFKAVATNAYQLSESEFESVIAAAEKRGLIGVEGGQIVED